MEPSDITKISEEEITSLTGGDDPYDDDVVLKKLFHQILSYCSNSRAGFKAEAVDTTGAGHAFVGGILNILASDPNLYKDEKRLREAVQFANACGAITVTERGAIPALPTKEAVLQILSKVSA
ncbi:hypothetical protein CMV_008966 [Castanea mollissima]|uniref:Carbohydrate kinase PfkB domain-containing protein n=1 Tax=Castanea mollissima TaxID=60419 RepID=A0A8J4W1Q5_9ROSI|nr:hypothetical protein CMV_008966 [Castanea mollissima]